MSRTIRRTEPHLLKWWLPDLKVLTTSRDDWRSHRLPGLLYSTYEPDIVRTVQSERHGFFCGPKEFARNQWHRKFRQRSRLEIHHAIREQDHREIVLDPLIYYPYMW